MLYLSGRHGYRFVTVFVLDKREELGKERHNININAESWWGRCRLAVGKGWPAWLPFTIQERLVSSPFDYAVHALLPLFAFVARVGDLTRQAGLDSLVLCRRRLPLSTAKVVTA
jgi:hypothetical protein